MPSGGARANAGRPPFQPTDQQRAFVEIGIAGGFLVEDIARVVGIDPTTLRKHFGEEIATAKTKRNAAVVGALFKNAIDGNVTAQIYWTKAQMGWKESQHLELTGKDGGAISYEEKLQQLHESAPSA